MWDTVISMPYGDRFRKHRRLMSQVLNSQAIGVYRDFQSNNTKDLLKNLLHEPEKFDQHILRFVLHSIVYAIRLSGSLVAGSQAYTTLVRVTYGLNVVSDDDAIVALFGESLDCIVKEGAPGASILDLFPIRE